MTDNPVLDVAMGLMGMFLCLSLVCTIINELVATLASLRAKTLAAGLRRIIDDNALCTAFLGHGLVQSARAASGGIHPSYLAGEDFAMALLGSLDATKAPTIAAIEEAVGKLPPSNIRDALIAHLIAANGQLDQLRTNVARWFDQSMDRVSGVYKRKIKLLGFVVAVLVALTVNADAINVYTLLWHDSSLRSAAAARAYSIVDPTSNADADGGVASYLQSNANAAPVVNLAVNEPQSLSRSMTVAQLIHIEDYLRPLPIGWTAPVPPTAGKSVSICWQILTKATGVLLTVLAISLGAPFWFDVLSKVTNIRGTGLKPGRTG